MIDYKFIPPHTPSDEAGSFVLEKIQELEERIRVLEATQPEIDYRAPYNDPKECRAHTCGYFTHYQAYGPAELTHEGYHAAERCLHDASERMQAWMDKHRDDYRPVPQQFIDACERWEKAVRA